jgi:hypothetical protein
MRLMLLILLIISAAGGAGAAVGTFVTRGDPQIGDHARRLDRNRIIGGLAGAGTGFIGCWIVLWRRAGSSSDSGFFVGD